MISRVPPRQHGVALIMAVLIVALATILAIDVGFKAFLDQRRAATSFAMEQAFEVGQGAEAWAADILKEDGASGGKRDDLTERWATPIPPLPIDGGEVEGQLQDLQGRFNLNSLVVPEQNGQLRMNQPAYEQLVRLLELLELEPHWAAKIVDWIDPDDNPVNSDGAEDNVYTTQTPPYRAANMPMTRVSELLSLPGFGADRYRRLAPHVTALPRNVSTINVCTASAYVLDSMLGDNTNHTLSIESLTKARENGCFPGKTAFKNELAGAHDQASQALKYFQDHIGETSDFFEADIWISIGTTQFALYSLLHRDPNPPYAVGPFLRSFGTR